MVKICSSAGGCSVFQSDWLNHGQCDQIGLLLKSLGDIFSFKINPNIGQLFGLFWKHLLKSKILLCGNIVENWATFNSSVWSHCWWQSMDFNCFSRCSIFVESVFCHLELFLKGENFGSIWMIRLNVGKCKKWPPWRPQEKNYSTFENSFCWKIVQMFG